MSVVRVFIGRVTDEGKLDLPPAVRGLMAQQIAALKGKPVELTIRQHRQKRSDRASRYYFGVVVPIIADFCGYDKDEMHEALAMKFLRIEDDPITGSPRRKHTPQTDSKEFATYVDDCRRFAATELNLYIPDPGEVIPA